MNNNFCPFVNSQCKQDCVFKVRQTATSQGVSDCFIFTKLDAINDCQPDQLTEISRKLDLLLEG